MSVVSPCGDRIEGDRCTGQYTHFWSGACLARAYEWCYGDESYSHIGGPKCQMRSPLRSESA